MAKRTFNVRLEPEQAERLRKIAESFGAVSPSGALKGQPAVSVLIQGIADGRYMILPAEDSPDA